MTTALQQAVDEAVRDDLSVVVVVADWDTFARVRGHVHVAVMAEQATGWNGKTADLVIVDRLCSARGMNLAKVIANRDPDPGGAIQIVEV